MAVLFLKRTGPPHQRTGADLTALEFEPPAMPCLIAVVRPLLLVLITATAVPAQARSYKPHRARANEVRPMLGGQLMFQGPRLVERTLPGAAALPFIGLGVDVGGSLMHRDRWGFALQGSLLAQGYLLCADGVCLDLYHGTQRFEARTWWMLRPRDGQLRSLRMGLGFGYHLQNRNDGDDEKNNVQFVFHEPLQARPYLVPEVGRFFRVGASRTEVSLRYVIHLDRTPAWTTVATSPVGTATFTASGDHLALVLRYHIGIRRAPEAAPPVPDVAREQRAWNVLDTLHTRREHIVLWVKDNAEQDGDTLSILMNGKPVLLAHALTDHWHRVDLDLAPGANTVLAVAHNEGRVPPNTAIATVRAGHGRKRFLLRTGMDASQAIVLFREHRP